MLFCKIKPNWEYERLYPDFNLRLQIGAVSYPELLRHTFRNYGNFRFAIRLRNIWAKSEPPFFAHSAHENIFHEQVELQKQNETTRSFKILAVIFLLSSSDELWSRASHAIYISIIRFDQIDLCGLSKESYKLCKAAQDIIDGENRLTLYDLCNPNSISDNLFRLIINAHIIKKYGLSGVRANARF